MRVTNDRIDFLKRFLCASAATSCKLTTGTNGRKPAIRNGAGSRRACTANIALAVVGLGLLSLVHRDVARTVDALVEQFRIDPQNRLLHGLLVRVVGVRPRTLKEFGFGTLFYAALFATEGVGLILAKRWAEFMTLVVTVSFLPLEVYELVVHRSALKAIVVIVNVAVALYLWRLVRRQTLQ